MNISSLVPSVNDLPGFGKSATAAAGEATAAAGTATADGSTSPGSSAAMREILAHYDMTDISPNDFSQMVQKLYNNGAISQQDLQTLSGIRADLDKSGIPSDTSINLVDFYRNQLQQAGAQSNGKTANSAATQAIVGRMSWVEKFSAIHNQPEGASVDATV